MTDRMRESLFSSLGPLDGASVLDLYAGSGALGLEALSRGAAHVVFVENAREAIVRLEENVAATGFADDCDVLWADVGSTLSKGAVERVDLIFMDPPYSLSRAVVLGYLEDIVTEGWLADDGRVVVHRPAREAPPNPLGLHPVWDRDFGGSQLFVYAHEDD